jgi:hypothetical protein
MKHLFPTYEDYRRLTGRLYESDARLNVADTPLEKARAYAASVFEQAGKKLDDVLPDFDANYRKLQAAVRKAPDIPRIQMPVIEPDDMADFHRRLTQGRLDIFKPHAGGVAHFMGANWHKMSPKEGEQWVTLGVKDGKKKDDVVRAKWTKIEGGKLLPTQAQIWLNKVVTNIAKFGVPKPGSQVTNVTIIVSKEGYILDGHHRYGQVVLADPSVALKALKIPLDIKTLLKVGRSYGGAVGNSPKP